MAVCGGLRRGLSRPRRSTSPHDLRVHVPESCRRRHVDSNCRPGPRGPVSRLARPRKPNLRPFRRGMLKPSCRGRAMLMLRGFVPWGLPGPTRGRRRGDAASALEKRRGSDEGKGRGGAHRVHAPPSYAALWTALGINTDPCKHFNTQYFERWETKRKKNPPARSGVERISYTLSGRS